MTRIAAFGLVLAITGTAHAGPCADFERARTALESDFAGVATRKDGRLETLPFPLFGKDGCYVDRVWGVSTKRRITCLFIARQGTIQEMDAFARAEFQRLAPQLKACLTTHEPFDNRPNEDPDDQISERQHYRSHDGRETWGLTVEPGGLPKAALSVDYETDAAEAEKQKVMPEFLQNVLAGQACETVKTMEAIARSDFAGVQTTRLGNHPALAKPLGGADECLLARDRARGENVVACSWIRETPDHAKVAATMNGIHVRAVRSCRSGWTETAKRGEIEFAAPTGDTIKLGVQSGDALSVAVVAVTVKTGP